MRLGKEKYDALQEFTRLATQEQAQGFVSGFCNYIEVSQARPGLYSCSGYNHYLTDDRHKT